jgi:hypothetical protein
MSPARNRSKLVGPCLNLVAGLLWLFVAFLRFDRLSGLHSRDGEGLLPCVAGLLFLVSAALGFRNWMRGHDGEVQSKPL